MSNSSSSSPSPPSCSVLLEPQPGLSDFDLLKLIGKGHSGRVYLARDRLSRELVAIKVIQKGQGHDSRTIREQEIQKELSGCSFLLPLWASWHDTDNFYLVTRYLGGHDMAINLAVKTRFTEERARFYAAELLIALEQMKTQMVLHRDLKPANIVFTPSGHIRVIDFGFATRLKVSPITDMDFMADPNASSGSFTINDPDYTSAERVGTPSFMSPDVHLGRPYSFEADLHALGVTLYNMLTGRLPFGEGVQSHEELLEAVLCEQLTFRSDDPVSPEARDLLSQLLRRDSNRPARLDDILYHPWFSQVCWDKVRLQTTTPHWKPHPTPLPKSATVCTVMEGAACSPDLCPDFTYVSPELLSLRSRGQVGIWKKIGAFFNGKQSPAPATPPPASPVQSVSKSEVSVPSSPPNIPLPPPPTHKPVDVDPTLLEILSCPSPTQSYSPGAGGVLPPLSIRRKLAQRAPPPVKARPIRGDVTRMPEVTITPADSKDEIQEVVLSNSSVVPFTEVANQRLLSPIDAERPTFTPVKVGPLVKLSAPPKRAKRAQKENVGLNAVTNAPSQTPQPQPQIQSNPIVALKPTVAPKPTVASKPTIASKPPVASKPTVTPEPTVASKPTIALKPVASRSAVTRSPPTAVFMIPPKVVPLPLILPNPSPIRTPTKAMSKTKAAPKPPLKTSPYKFTSPKAAPKPPSKTSPPKFTSPKIKPAFKVPSKVTHSGSKFQQHESTVRRRNSRTPASPSSVPSLDFTDTREGVYPRAMVQDKTLFHPALAFAEARERPENYPRPPHVTQTRKSAPSKQPSVDNSLSLPPTSPSGHQETRENVAPVPTDDARPCSKDTQDSSPSAQVSPPLVAVETPFAGQLIVPPPTGFNDWRRLFAKFSMALRCLFSWVRYRGAPGTNHL